MYNYRKKFLFEARRMNIESYSLTRGTVTCTESIQVQTLNMSKHLKGANFQIAISLVLNFEEAIQVLNSLPTDY